MTKIERPSVISPAGSLLLLFILYFTLGPNPVRAAALQDVTYSRIGNQVQVALKMSGAPPEPGSFTIDNPARIAIDLPGTQLALAKRSYQIDAGPARSLRAVESGGRTRLVLSLTHLVPYEITREGEYVYLTLNSASQGTAMPARAPTVAGASPLIAGKEIDNIDFRRGEEGQARIIVKLDPSTVVDMTETGKKIVVSFIGAKLPEELERRLNVTDFATPVTLVDAYNADGGARMVIDTTGPYEHLAYQANDTYTVEVKPVEVVDETPRAGTQGAYVGEKLSLNFQNIEVRAVLQLIADFTGLNIVASDTVQGTITLRLKNVPWDQALEIILKTKGLGMRQNGNVVLIAPNEEIAAREKQELEAFKQLEDLTPLRTEFFQVNYAKAEDLSSLLKSEDSSILSERGQVTVDSRTNTLMVLDTPDKLEEIARLIETLDIPIRQVLIESRIVVANDDFSKEIGVRTGVTSVRDGSGGSLDAGDTDMIAISGSATGTSTMTDSALDNLATTGGITPVELPGLDDRLNVNLPTSNGLGSLALAILGADYLVDLELSALQTEGRGEVISNPRVITANQQEAVIKQGVEVPYTETAPNGGTTVAFKEAVLSLKVKPHITPDDRVIMDLQVNKDSVGEVVSGIPTINTRAVETQVLVNNGETVVLGGVYEHNRLDTVDKIPFLGDLPILGALFRHTVTMDDKAELLIFVTPKLIKEGVQVTLE